MTLEERYRALGLEPPAEDEGEKEQEVAEPAETSEPEQDQQIDEVGGDDMTAAGIDADDGEDEDDEGANEREVAGPAAKTDNKPAQSKSERAENARRRREAEKAEAIRQALEAERAKNDAEIKELFGWAGFKDGTNPIESMQQLRDYKARAEAAQLSRDLQAGKLTPDALKGLVRQELQGMMPQNAGAAPGQQEPERIDREAFERQVESELREIAKFDPTVQTVEDLRRLDRADEFLREVRDHRHTFLEAYRIVYADDIAGKQARQAAAASAQRTRNADRSKAHMMPTTARGSGDAPVPQSYLDKVAALMPKATPDSARQYYQKYARQSKK